MLLESVTHITTTVNSVTVGNKRLATVHLLKRIAVLIAGKITSELLFDFLLSLFLLVTMASLLQAVQEMIPSM